LRKQRKGIRICCRNSDHFLLKKGASFGLPFDALTVTKNRGNFKIKRQCKLMHILESQKKLEILDTGNYGLSCTKRQRPRVGIFKVGKGKHVTIKKIEK
jgi:hypothetical protein